MSSARRRRRQPLLLLTAALVVLAAAAQAQPVESTTDDHDDHRHEQPHIPAHPHEHGDSDPYDEAHAHSVLPIDAGLTLGAVVAITLQRFPDFQTLEAHEAQALSWQRRGRSLIAGRPQLQLRYQTDRIGPDDGLLEYEGGLQLPLWRPGERSAVRRLGRELARESQAARDALHWEVAGLVREAHWAIEIATVEVDMADRRLLLGRRLSVSVERRHRLGDVARADVLLARAAELDALVAHNEAEALLRDAEVAWRTLTTLARRPERAEEPDLQHGHLEADHPALRLADAAIARAVEAREQAELSASASPTLTLGPRQERPPQTPAAGGPREDSFGISLSLPIGGSVHTATVGAAMGREVAAARARRDQLLRELSLQLHEAEHELAVARRNRGARDEQATLTAESLAMAQSAYASGELELAEVLRIQDRAVTAEALAAQARLVEARQIARLRQAIGDLP